MVVREFDLDSTLGGVVSAVQLFKLGAPDSFIQFRDKVHFILGQLPIHERPHDGMLARWLYERLKRVIGFGSLEQQLRSVRLTTCGLGLNVS